MALVLIVWMAWPSLYFAPAAQARVLRVPQDYPTIQAAVDAANQGDTIHVSAGTYSEGVVINKSLSLVGECRSFTVITPGVWVNASRVSISNFTVMGEIYLGPVEGSAYAWLKNISRCVVANNTIIGAGGRGIPLNFCSHSVIIGNNVSGAEVLLTDSSDNIVIQNHITNPYSTGTGIFLMSGWREKGFVSDRNIIAYNNITNCGYHGVFLSGSDSNVIFGNNVTNNGWGEPGAGIRVCNIYGVEHNYVFHNNFVNNTRHHASVLNYETENSWDDGYPSGGNYYDDYAGVDGDGDGIGDTPYKIPATIEKGNESNVDRYPLMNPYRPVCSMTIEPLKTVVGDGFSAPINLTLTNPSAEADTFNLKVQANALTIHTQNITLQGGGSTSISLAWNTTSFAKGTYRITAQLTASSGRRDTFYALPPWIFVSIPGDVDANRLVDIYDIVLITSVYDAKVGDLKYSSNRDINNDGIIDIFDVVHATSRYEEKW
jgi:parallel beta-helix repeat protein